MNFAQIKSLQTPGVLIETQMTYEEKNLDGSITVFRLLRVSLKKLIKMQMPDSDAPNENRGGQAPRAERRKMAVIENEGRVQDILDNAKKVCGHVTVGMTKTEVTDLIGSPPAQPGPYPYFERNNIWPYENTWIKFNSNDIVQSLIGCGR